MHERPTSEKELQSAMYPQFILITPARNEVRYVGETIESMLAQSRRPRKWVIVSDGSTDGTDDLVRRMTENVEWIDLLRMPERQGTHFAGKVNAFNRGLESVKGLGFDYLGNLDADLSFDRDYFEYLLANMDKDSRLGVCGTPFVEQGIQVYDYRFTNVDHVSGACQLFRSQCFEEIGGYTPIEVGGIDWVAVTTARMKGWKTRTYTGRHLVHHRAIGSVHATGLDAWWRAGRKDYLFGNHPLWELFRSLYQMKKGSPVFLGGISLFIGFALCYLKRPPRPISKELMAFIRCEQAARLKKIAFSFLNRFGKAE